MFLLLKLLTHQGLICCMCLLRPMKRKISNMFLNVEHAALLYVDLIVLFVVTDVLLLMITQCASTSSLLRQNQHAIELILEEC